MCNNKVGFEMADIQTHEKVKLGNNDQEMPQSERNSHSMNRGVGKKLK